MTTNYISRRKFNFFSINSLFLLSSTELLFAQETLNKAIISEALKPRYLGATNAPIKLIEYFSMTCSHCADFHLQTLPKIKKQYIDEGLVRLEMRDFPLDGIALRASAMARIIEEDKYYNLVEILLKNQKKWTRNQNPIKKLKQYGRMAGISSELLDQSMDDMELLEGIFKMRQFAEKEWGIKSTPSFIINREIVISGNVTFKRFEDAFAKFKS